MASAGQATELNVTGDLLFSACVRCRLLRPSFIAKLVYNTFTHRPRPTIVSSITACETMSAAARARVPIAAARKRDQWYK